MWKGNMVYSGKITTLFFIRYFLYDQFKFFLRIDKAELPANSKARFVDFQEKSIFVLLAAFVSVTITFNLEKKFTVHTTTIGNLFRVKVPEIKPDYEEVFDKSNLIERTALSFRGLSFALSHALVSGVVTFVGYEVLKELHLVEKLNFAGASLVGMASCAAAYPLNTIMRHCMLAGRGGITDDLPNKYDLVNRNNYKGLSVTLLRQIPLSYLQFVIFRLVSQY